MNREEKRIEITVEAVKQQITLCAGVIAAVVALVDPGSPISDKLPYVLPLLLISALFGVGVLLTIPFALYGEKDPFAAIAVRTAGIAQAFFFCAGLWAAVGATFQNWRGYLQSVAPTVAG